MTVVSTSMISAATKAAITSGRLSALPVDPIGQVSFRRSARGERSLLKRANFERLVADPIIPANGVDPTQPRAELGVSDPDVLVGILDACAEQRKEAGIDSSPAPAGQTD